MFVDKASSNALKELKSYSWKTKDDRVLDEPVKIRDDFVDSLRYAVHSYMNKPKKAKAYTTKPF